MMSSERLLAALHAIGGAAMLALSTATSFWPFFVLMLVYQMVYVPTLSLTNSMCFHHASDPKDFGRIRLWGTVGWIAASWPFVFLLAGKSGPELHAALRSIFWVAAIASFALSAFSLALPSTPPAKSEDARSAPGEVIALLAVPGFLVLFIVTFMDALVHQGYFQWTSPFLERAGVPPEWIMPAMSIGQIAEIATMAVLGLVLRRLGWRWTMAVGISAHALRFFVFAIGDPLWLMVAVNVVHGLCYAFFFAAVYIFVDEHFPKRARASAQLLFNLLILGVGPFVGSLLWGHSGIATGWRTARSISDASSSCPLGSALQRWWCCWWASGRRASPLPDYTEVQAGHYTERVISGLRELRGFPFSKREKKDPRNRRNPLMIPGPRNPLPVEACRKKSGYCSTEKLRLPTDLPSMNASTL